MQPETLEFYPKWPSFQSWNFARTDNYLQDKHGLSKKQNKIKKQKDVQILGYISSITLAKTVTMF